MKNTIVSFVCGLIFALGLGIAGMTSPAKVLAFLDVTSQGWDPSLAFVMIGAIGVHALVARKHALPTERIHLDAPLLIGAAVFGVGWGLAGFCPGPAIVALTGSFGTTAAFVAAMLGGMWATQLGTRQSPRSKSALRANPAARDHR
jgi:uncharacterized membrane protein YedE/YeeE